MDITILATYINEVLKGVSAPVGGNISIDKLSRPRMRLQGIINTPPTVIVQEVEGETIPLLEEELRHCAAVIAAAFLNPYKADWDYDRFSHSSKDKRLSDKFFPKLQMGKITLPATVVDKHGKILMWYLPGLLLPHRVEELNRATVCLKDLLGRSMKSGRKSKGWRQRGFITANSQKKRLGAGKLSLTVGNFQQGHMRLQDQIFSSPVLGKGRPIQPVRKWLELIQPAEELLNAVLWITHPEMWSVNRTATTFLIKQLEDPSLKWPTVYPGMDIIANRVTPEHCDRGGALSFYDHLVSLGQDHDAKLKLHDFQAEFAYKPGTSVLFSGKVLAHSVPQWSEGERLVFAHYAKDDVQDRLDIATPSLPTQLGWWSNRTI